MIKVSFNDMWFIYTIYSIDYRKIEIRIQENRSVLYFLFNGIFFNSYDFKFGFLGF